MDQTETQETKKTPEEVKDVVIVGMGPAGLYTGWRLAKADANQTVFGQPSKAIRVALYDTMQKDRVGGRLCTQPLPGYPFLAELGAMRYRSTQLLVNGLVEVLGLKKDRELFDFPQHFFFLREKTLVESDFTNVSNTDSAYVLNENERGLLPHQLIERAIQDTLRSLRFGRECFNSYEMTEWKIDLVELVKKLNTDKGLHSLTLKEWALIKRFGEYKDQNYLCDVGFWDLLQFQLSSGAWHLAHDGLGYESIMGNWNAAIALPWFLTDFAKSTAFTLKNGMKSITDRLYEEINKAPNFNVHHGYDLTGIDLQECPNGTEKLIRLQFTEDENPEPQTVLTRSVVLALPKGALIRLNLSDQLVAKASIPKGAPPGFDPRTWFSDLLGSVDGRALFKLFLGYSSPWWTTTKWWQKNMQGKLEIHGKVNTDLPLRQIYYYGQEHWNEERRIELGLSQAKHQHSMLMASYSDSHYVEFWSELRKKKNRAHGPENFSERDQRAFDQFGAPLTMIMRAEHQLALLHGMDSKDLPRAERGLYMEWSRPPYYAGWHSWKVGVKPWKICDTIMRPFEDTRVFICGEAYSNEQGWTEGALKSAERLLSLVFELPLPSELLLGEFDGDKDKLMDYIDALEEENWPKVMPPFP